MDVMDTIFDLFLFRDLKLENFILILKNLWIDKPIVILFFIFYFYFFIQSLYIKSLR